MVVCRRFAVGTDTRLWSSFANPFRKPRRRAPLTFQSLDIAALIGIHGAPDVT